MFNRFRIMILAGLISSWSFASGWGELTDNGYALAQSYIDQRQAALSITPDSLGFDAGPAQRVYGLLVETGYDDAIVTLVTLADGTTSLHLCNGGGFTGLGHYAAIRKSTEALLALAQDLLPQAEKVASFPLPDRGRTRFYFLTSDGVFSAEFSQDDLVNGRLPLSPLFLQAREVIARLSIWDKRSQAMLEYSSRGDVPNILKMLEMDPLLAEARDDTGLTPLMAAAYAGSEEAVMVLLEANARLDVKDNEGFTALMFAANAGKIACARLLIDAGAAVNEHANDGSTPLMFAAQYGYNDVVRFLLENGADPRMAGTHGLTALGLARQNGLKDTADILASRE